MKNGIILCILVLCLCGCRRYEPATELTRADAGLEASEAMGQSGEEKAEGSETEEELVEISIDPSIPYRQPMKVKGIYVSAYVAGTGDMMDTIIEQIDRTELNAVVIDVKDDQGRVTYSMDLPLVNEIQACQLFIRDMPGLMEKLRERDIYPIARVVAFRDPYLAEKKPEWCIKNGDGSIYRDRNGLAWVNPYKHEVWDYLVDIGRQAGRDGFREIQFDYIRFSVDKGMDDVVFDEADTLGRERTEVITDFVEYAGKELMKEGLFVSADVFGTIIESDGDSAVVGQNYAEMAEKLDYMCPMIYPSHYAPGNFGLENPDANPYETVCKALEGSRLCLEGVCGPEGKEAAVRPWLQDFTASYLNDYIDYGDNEVRQQIQAVYDSGYDEWILWDAGVSYHYGGLLSPEEAEAENEAIAASRAALTQPEDTAGEAVLETAESVTAEQ